MEIKCLIEIFRNCFNRGAGDILLAPFNKADVKAQVVGIEQQLRVYQESIGKFRESLIADKDRHTLKRNGAEIRTEQVITDFLNHNSELIKKVLF